MRKLTNDNTILIESDDFDDGTLWPIEHDEVI